MAFPSMRFSSVTRGFTFVSLDGLDLFEPTDWSPEFRKGSLSM